MVTTCHGVVTYIRWNLCWLLTSSHKRCIGGWGGFYHYITLIRFAVSHQDATSYKDSGNIRHMEWAAWHALKINHLACINYQRVGKFMNFEVHWVINHNWGWGLKRRFPHPLHPLSLALSSSSTPHPPRNVQPTLLWQQILKNDVKRW